MSFYDDASLVVIPSAQKTSKLYAVKPTDGSGDLAFTRTGDTATRVNSAGLIERVRTNLVLQSETFNTTWSASRGAVTANATTAPNGTTTADKFVADTQVNPHFISQSIASLTNGGIYTSSVYAKAGEWNSIAIFRFDSAIGVSFRLDTQAMTVLAGSPVTYSITDAGNGWYRCSVSFAIASTSDGAQFRVGNNGAYSIAGNNVNGLFLWGAQYETTDFGATPYIPTLTAAVSTGPVANVPRLDYTGSTCPRLLLEPQRTNLLQFSEQFNNAYWSLSGATITSNTTVAPDGTQSADTLTGVSGNFRVFRVVSGLSNIDYSFSVFVKQGTSNTVKLDFVNVSDGPIFNFTTKTFTTVSGFTTRFEQHANGWFRLFATRVSNTTSAGLGINVAGAGQTVFIWGAVMEAGSYGTSYIPSLAASATRGVDDATKTGITSLIGQTEGTLFLDFEGGANDSANHFLGLSDGTTGNRIVIVRSSSNTLYAQIRIGGVEQAFIQTATLTANTRYKCAIAYKLNDIALYVNGALVGTDTSATIPATSVFATNTGVSSSYFERAINQTLVFKTRLSNAQLAELTTL